MTNEPDDRTTEQSPVTSRLLSLFNEAGIDYRYIEHEPTYTSEESARVRGEDLRIGGKALLVKADDAFALAVLPADRKLDSRALKHVLGTRKLRFASKEELLQQTGLIPGSVPPFGSPIFDLPLYIDQGVFLNEKIAFNAGSLTASVVMGIDAYRELSRGNVASFTA